MPANDFMRALFGEFWPTPTGSVILRTNSNKCKATWEIFERIDLRNIYASGSPNVCVTLCRIHGMRSLNRKMYSTGCMRVFKA